MIRTVRRDVIRVAIVEDQRAVIGGASFITAKLPGRIVGLIITQVPSWLWRTRCDCTHRDAGFWAATVQLIIRELVKAREQLPRLAGISLG